MSRADGTLFDSWKEIAAYLGRDLRTVRRWEKERFLPVHRVPGGGRRAVYAYRSEIDEWLLRERDVPADHLNYLRPIPPPSESESPQPSVGEPSGPPAVSHSSSSSHLPTPKGSVPPGIWAEVALALVAAALLLIFIFPVSRSPQAADPTIPGLPILPVGVRHWVRISLVNAQPESVPGPFQQLLVVDSSRYSSFEAENLQNIEFFDERGRIVRSWLESGNSNLSARTAYWIELSDGIPASKVVNIYMGFAPPDGNLLNTDTTGEAPGLSPSYGQFDNGSKVFSRYANFARTSLPPGWYSGLTPGGQGEIRVSNGVFIAHSGRGGGSAFLASDWAVGDHVTEMDLLSQQTMQGQEMIFVCSASPTSFRWTPDSVGYQNMSGLEIENNNAGTPSVLAVAIPNPTQSSVIGFQGSTVFANYAPVAQVHSRICGGNYLASSVNTGFSASFSFDWARMRAPPPHGVMPVPIFGEIK